jgi:hypothetical protein
LRLCARKTFLRSVPHRFFVQSWFRLSGLPEK